MEKNKIVVYTDGSSLGNPGPGGWGAVIVFPEGRSEDRVVELGGGNKKTTNNRMELTAAIEALKAIDNISGDVVINTDSQYVKNGITKWVHGWQQKGWMTAAKKPVLNRDLWEELIGEEKRRKNFGNVLWEYVEGHIGHAGNERADAIAVSFAEGKEAKLYDGSASAYKINLSGKCSEKQSAEKSEKRERAKAKAYSYLSLVDGVAKRHKTWAECETRVKGKKAKFRKTLSNEDEKEILSTWGVSLDKT
jgi:ribonuclease HI